MIDQCYMDASSCSRPSLHWARPGQTNYSAAKEGIVGLARSAANELRQHGITVNAVYPGGRTRMVESIPESAVEWLREQVAKRPGSYPVADLVASPEPDEALVPESNAPKIVYLCTDAAAGITGQVIGTHGWGTALFSPRRPVKDHPQRRRLDTRRARTSCADISRHGPS